MVFRKGGGSDKQSRVTMQHILCDGKGHERIEDTFGSDTNITIVDHLNNTAFVLIPGSKKALRWPIPDDDPRDESGLKRIGAKSLGVEKIAGHNCHGWEYSIGKRRATTWIGDDTHYIVRNKNLNPQGTSSLELIRWSTKAPPADAFKLPLDYTIQSR